MRVTKKGEKNGGFCAGKGFFWGKGLSAGGNPLLKQKKPFQPGRAGDFREG